MQYTLKLNKINCFMQDEGDGDEVYLKYKGERIWPLKDRYITVKDGDEQEVNVEIASLGNGTTIEIELWDYDILTENDRLGVFKMLVNERGGPFTTDLRDVKPMGAKYALEWEVH